mmetsp:Transcript_46871/g.109481  ORF Transcript_46871/g.109481 Transcript_46871/m.109481 type:complete len:218 (-) Transcript_46871:959-1612(-)
MIKSLRITASRAQVSGRSSKLKLGASSWEETTCSAEQAVLLVCLRSGTEVLFKLPDALPESREEAVGLLLDLAKGREDLGRNPFALLVEPCVATSLDICRDAADQGHQPWGSREVEACQELHPSQNQLDQPWQEDHQSFACHGEHHDFWRLCFIILHGKAHVREPLLQILEHRVALEKTPNGAQVPIQRFVGRGRCRCCRCQRRGQVRCKDLGADEA